MVKKVVKPKNRRVLLLDTVLKQDTHHLNKHKLSTIGDVTPENFKLAVYRAFNGASARGGANIVYLAEILPDGRPKLIARLYQAKRNKYAKKQYKMFSAIHHPDGTRLLDKAFKSRAGGLKFVISDKVYPSRPPIPPNMNTLLKKLVRS